MHSHQICTMALDLLSGTRHFCIPHRPYCKLQIRIGLHTGEGLEMSGRN